VQSITPAEEATFIGMWQQGRETAMIAQRLGIAHIKQVEVRCR